MSLDLDYTKINKCETDDELLAYLNKEFPLLKKESAFFAMILPNVKPINNQMRFFYFYMASKYSLYEFIEQMYFPEMPYQDLKDTFDTFMSDANENMYKNLRAFMSIFKTRTDFDAKSILEKIAKYKDSTNVSEILDATCRPEMSEIAEDMLRQEDY